jgi:hypothetical protein
LSPEEFAKFRHDAVHELMRLNVACEREFQISSWPRWHYDLDRASLKFLKDEISRVVASIQVVGTTSTRSGTWLWSWANEHIPRQASQETAQVRAFGERECLPDLTTSKLVDDESLGWALTSISAKILGAKGAYRCPGENGFLYLVYTNIAFSVATRASTERGRVKCDSHDGGYETFVCEHLVSNPAQFWFSDDPTKENKWPDAWCGACDLFFQEEGEWTEKNEPKMKIRLVCHHCYESLRSQARM